jgi:hypothetical protein
VPFGGDNWMVVMAEHLTKDPVPIRKRNSRVSPALEAVVLKAMRRYPEHRYDNADALMADLDHLDCLDLSSVRPRHPSRRWVGLGALNSNKQIWMLIAITTAICLVIAVVVIVLAVVL